MYAQQFELMDSLDYSLTGFKRSKIMLTPGAKYQFFGTVITSQPVLEAICGLWTSLGAAVVMR